MNQPTPAPGSLRDLAYEAIRERIVEGGWHPGRRIVERDVAAELGISRIPLREALRRLHDEGLVILVPRQGALVSPFTPADVSDLFDIREYLEELAARRAAERADESILSRLREPLRAAEDARARGDERGLALANATFHTEVVNASGNALLQSIMDPLATKLRWLFRLTSVRDPGRQCAEHAQLFEAIAARDSEKAGTLARAHAAAGRELSMRMAEEWSDPRFNPITATRTRRRGPKP
ncbi:GntR family transcriptional regulator [Microtetraspora malaysiensis]|uniref:GntR family transcriptional regulator n=1 Tax=Microtetraspora malaysiensis TaxID=161358 RepID=UPI000831321D|nr:GntR family transcriptional regulator [Microtetraspora malaysiensis]